MSIISNNIWVEKYRPHTLDDCILPNRIKDQLREMITNNNVINYSAVGSSGSGKTSSIRAICEELGIDYLLINMSNENGIDTVRNKIVGFASTMSFTSNYKVIILDEFDYANANSTQPALRGVIEQFQENCRFVITANYKSKIIEAIYSRCPIVDFNFSNDEKKEMLKQFITRIKFILGENNIDYDNKELINLCINKFPDFRGTITNIQSSIRGDELYLNSLGSSSSQKIEELIDLLKKQDFNLIRKWVVDNATSNDGHIVRRSLYNSMKDYVKDSSIPTMVMTINEYDYKESHVIDREVNMVAFLCALMVEVEFK